MRLRTERKKARLTQTELSDLSGVSQSNISRLETGDIFNTGFAVLDLLARALRRRGCKVDASQLQPPKQVALIKGFRVEQKHKRTA